VSLFHLTSTSRVIVFRVLRCNQSVSVSSSFCFPRCSPSLFGFLPWSAWVPLPLGRFRSFRFTTSLRLGPLSLVVPLTGFRCEIQFSLVAFLLTASCPARCLVSSSHRQGALSWLSIFLWGIWLPVPRSNPEPWDSAFPTFGVSTPLGFLCTLEVAPTHCYMSKPPSMMFLPFTLSSNSNSISIMAYCFT
jgi:hypothetical protein